MPTPYETRDAAEAAASARPRMVRPRNGRRVAGVCAGLAEHLGAPVLWVRIGFVVLAFWGGAGLLAYAFLWVLVPEDSSAVAVPARWRAGPVPASVGAAPGSRVPMDPAQPLITPPTDARGVGQGIGDGVGGAVDQVEPGLGGDPAAAPSGAATERHGHRHGRAHHGLHGHPHHRGRGSRTYGSDPHHDGIDLQGGALVVVGAIVAVAGLLLVGGAVGLDVPAGFVLPLLVVGVGAVIAWSQLDDAQRSRWLGADSRSKGPGLARLAIGLLLAAVGILALVLRGRSLTDLWDALLATLAVLAGVGLIAAPWVVRLWGDLRAEQVAAARATERADIAAHLHDSVLQTLALIQRRADDPQTVSQLARAQERELRSYLYAGPAGSEATLSAALTEVAHDVEDLHGIPVDLVVTGDGPLDPAGRALVQAFREALLNAVRHGRPPVTAYAEAGPGGVEAFVRDHGDGFDLDTVPEDRLGVRRSILGRMERHGGTARVRHLDQGTEVALTLPPTAVPTATPTAKDPA